MSECSVARMDVAERSVATANNSPGPRAYTRSVPAESCRCSESTDRLIAAYSRRRRRLIHRHRSASAIAQRATAVVVAVCRIELIGRIRSRADVVVEVGLSGATGL